MAASYKTITEVINVVSKHVDEQTFRAILADLKEVEGNSSFEETIRRLNKHYGQ
jgi:hypothetical protein